MEEKYMVNDTLQNSKEFVKALDEAILDSSNQELRQMLILMRNSAESFDGELRKIAESKGYYFPSPKADESEVVALKKSFFN